MKSLKLVEKKHIIGLILTFALSYFVSYLGRYNYSAVLVEIISETGMRETVASAPLTALFITYGFGQLISGYLGDKIPPEWLVVAGLVTSGAMNFSIPFAKNITLMTVIWAINGFAQALIWPPLVKLSAQYLRDSDYRRLIPIVSNGGLVGTIVIYLLTPLLIHLWGWKSVFIFASVVAIIVAVIWKIIVSHFEKKAVLVEEEVIAEEETEIKTGKLPVFVIFTLISIMLAMMFQGVLRDGVSTWMPRYISTAFDIGNKVSILTGVALPIFGILTAFFSAFVYRKVFKNEGRCAAAFSLLAAVSSLILAFASELNPVLSVVLLVLTNASAHGINLMFVSIVIPHFKKYGKTSFFAGLINSSVYVGSALSIYGLALLSEKFGWSVTFLSWFAVSLLAFLFSVLTIKPLNKMK